MPPKTVFTREDVIKAAFKIVRNLGIKNLSARRIAKKLKSSTAPVYSNFKSMDRLKNEVIIMAKDLLIEYSTQPYTERVFLNLGVGLVLFARDNSALFRAIFLESGEYKEIVNQYINSLRAELKKDPRFTIMTDEDRDALLDTMWIYTHGFASLICVGIIEQNNKEYIIEQLLDVGGVVIGAALTKYNQ